MGQYYVLRGSLLRSPSVANAERNDHQAILTCKNKLEAGAFETRGTIELVEGPTLTIEPEEKQSPARVVEPKVPTAFRWLAKSPFLQRLEAVDVG